jgi:hypothetical protein
MAVDLGARRRLALSHYALRLGSCCEEEPAATQPLQSWTLQGSEDGGPDGGGGDGWVTLHTGQGDASVLGQQGCAIAHWPVQPRAEAYRHFRLHCTAEQAPEGVDCTGIELYGALREVGV